MNNEVFEDMLADTTEWAEYYANDQGYVLNPNEKIRGVVLKGLAKNRYKYGEGYCPCKIVTLDFSKDEGNICPCDNHKKDIEGNGMCHCKLFFNPNYKF